MPGKSLNKFVMMKSYMEKTLDTKGLVGYKRYSAFLLLDPVAKIVYRRFFALA